MAAEDAPAEHDMTVPDGAAKSQDPPERSPWPALWALVLGFFMILVDTTIVSVATPAIMSDLHTDVDGVVWVTSGYLLAYAVPLLITGRLGDRFGPRRVYLAGLAIFTLASLWCGLTDSIGWLVAARVVQGLGASLMTPQTMAVITRTFPANSRGQAMSLWGATAGVATLVGPILGGVLVDGFGWEWIFFVNVPVAVLVIALTPRLIRESRVEGAQDFDAAGALTVTGGLALLVYAISKAPDAGWGSARTIVGADRRGRPAGGVHRDRDAGEPSADAVADLPDPDACRLEHRRPPARCRRLLELLPADAVRPAGAPLLGPEDRDHVPRDRWHHGDRRRNLAAPRDAHRPEAGDGAGVALITAGLVWYSQIPANGSYASDLLPGYLLVGFGLAFAFIPVSIAALAGVEERDAGLASGILNTAQQIGGAIGVAIAATISTTRASSLLKSGHDAAHAYTSGFALAFWVIAGIGAAGTVAAVVLVRHEKLSEIEPAPALS